MIDIDNISVRFKSADNIITALSSVSLHIKQGEYVAMLGPNGSGKSTLIRAICGMIQPVDGEIKLLDRELQVGKFGEDFFGDVGVVFQEPEGQFLMPTVRREIESILQNLGLPIEKQRERLEEITRLFHLNDILAAKPENLSGGQMQVVNLACAMVIHPQILILDEPTTFLDLHYRAILISYLESFHKKGMTIFHVTQFPDEAISCDRVCIIDKGNIVFDGKAQKALAGDAFLKEHRLSIPRGILTKSLPKISGDAQNAESLFPKIKSKPSKPQLDLELNSRNIVQILKAEQIKYIYPKSDFVLDIEKLELNKGEIVGVVGPAGSGKSTLAYLLSGLYEPNEGQIYYEGRRLADYHINELRRAIGITWQLPDLAMIGPTVLEDIEFGIENLALENVNISQLLTQVGLDGFENRIVDTLSGGEKRKLSIAGILATNPSYIILDEPAAFLDPVSQQELIEIIRNISKDDKGIMVIGHDVKFLGEIADRIIGLDSGRIQFDMQAHEFFTGSRYIRDS